MPNAQLKMLIETANARGEMFAYGDFRLRPGYSNVNKSKISFRSRFSKNITVEVPIIAAAMDTVCESDMAIAMAKLGGIGIIHRKMTPKVQDAEVARVKHALHGFIQKPIILLDTQTIASVDELRAKKSYNFHSFPVEDSRGRFVGLVTGRDFEVAPDKSLAVGKIMTRLSKLVAAKVGTTKEMAYQLMLNKKVKVVPLIDSNRRLRGIYVRKDLVRIFEGKARHNVDCQHRLRVGAAIGDTVGERARALLLDQQGCDVIVIDMAHAHTERARKQLQWLKKNVAADIVVGNICTGEAALFLAEAGADGVKVGHGPGSICTTRIIAGTGVTQLTAVAECAIALEGTGTPVCADGGIKYSGDVPIALAAGASTVMIGNLLARTEEAPGTVIRDAAGKPSKVYRGMGSEGVINIASVAESDRYQRRGVPIDEVVAEGVEGTVPFEGPVRKVVGQLVGGMRTGFAYVGANSVEELQQKARFGMQTAAGIAESHPHDIRMTKQPANYS